MLSADKSKHINESTVMLRIVRAGGQQSHLEWRGQGVNSQAQKHLKSSETKGQNAQEKEKNKTLTDEKLSYKTKHQNRHKRQNRLY